MHAQGYHWAIFLKTTKNGHSPVFIQTPGNPLLNSVLTCEVSTSELLEVGNGALGPALCSGAVP